MGSLVSLGKIGNDIRGFYFLKKIWLFLRETENISQEDRDKYIAEMELDEKQFNKTCEQLLLIIERLDAMEKAAMIGRLYKARVEGRISEDQFLVTSQIVDRMMHGDLALLRQHEKVKEAEREHLHGLRLLDWHQSGSNLYGIIQVHSNYSLSEYGKILLAETEGI